MTLTCANCSSSLQPEFDYCPYCSQKTHLHRLSLHDIFHDALHYFTHADKGILGLMRDLTLKTGTVAREYVTGRRKKYFPPLNFFLIVATVFVLIMSAVTPNTPYDAQKEHPEISRIPDKAQQQRVAAIYERQHKAVHFMNKYANTVAMIAVPLICLLYWLFYVRGPYNYTEHLIACLYMVGFSNLVYVLVFVPASLIAGMKQSKTSMVTVFLFMVFQIIYAAVFYYRFMNKGTKGSAWKATGVSIAVITFWFVLSSFLVMMYIQSGFWGLMG